MASPRDETFRLEHAGGEDANMEEPRNSSMPSDSAAEGPEGFREDLPRSIHSVDVSVTKDKDSLAETKNPSHCEHATFAQPLVSPDSLEMHQSRTGSEARTDDSGKDIDDYFAAKNPYESKTADFARPRSPLVPLLMDGTSATQQDSTSSDNASTESRSASWKDFSTQTVIGPSFNAGSTRPTSVPNFQTKSISRRREVADCPSYPDQSFKSLQDQQHPAPYKPRSPQPSRTRSSHASQNCSISSTNDKSMDDVRQPTSGAKTVGNTPAQSPGLFSPLFPVKKHWANDSDDGRSSTPMLHPSHHKEPKETHKLLKDIDPVSGRKLINHYEILQKLGSGQHGTVKQGRDLDSGEMVAIKIVRRFSKRLRLGRSGDPNEMIKKEVAILKKARHPHVVSLIEVIDDDEFGKVYLVLEYVERGEIIWRKQTDKDIALFEMERNKREMANDVDSEFERQAVEDFNNGVPARRADKARRLEEQRHYTKAHIKAHGSHGQGPDADRYWSLELAGELEAEHEAEIPSHITPQANSQLKPLQPPSETAEGSPQSDTPTHTPKPLPHAIETEQLPSTAPSSRPETPDNLEGTMWGSYLEETPSHLTLTTTIDQIIAAQTHWNPEEEDYRYVPCLTLLQALDAFRDTVLGLEYLHYQGIIHRDIKPANLLWNTDYRVKISDFGVSYLGKPIREDDNGEEIPEADAANLDEAIELAKTVGTPAFYAPELCDPQYFEIGTSPERPAITGQIDVWALGVTLYAMVFGRLPFVDSNEFQMYEKIARKEVFIPRWRLKGVPHTDRTPSNHNKRLDDVLEYEEVDDELRDLLKQLLKKNPADRINLKAVKHHPWILKGIPNGSTWIDETDPSVQSQGRKIEVSTQEVQDAVIGLTLVDRVKAGIQRVGSVLRGRGSRKRGDSNPKHPDAANSTSSTKSSTSLKEHRRSSLRGDEQIYTALRASREASEHPLAYSQTASPEYKESNAYFEETGGARPASEPLGGRPVPPDRTWSAADSMKTIRPPPIPAARDVTSLPNTSCGDEFSSLATVVEPTSSSSSSLGGIFGGAGRRFVNSMRSRERGTGRQSPSQSSRSSSVDTNIEDPHASPSLALSSAIAAGHVDPPPALREELELHHLPNESSSEAFQRAQEENYRRATLEYTHRTGRRSTVGQAADVPCPPSPDDELFYNQQRPPSVTDSVSMFPIVSSSSEQIVSGESTAQSRIPSVVSRASSLSATVEEGAEAQALGNPKAISELVNRRVFQQMGTEDLNATPALAKAAAEDEAGYNGEGEQDSESEDEGLAMA
ncbi:hypothetical protein MMC21_007287 [Puttea exsequens]|nr:hypothetical protein [Puttea exsequens]